MDSFLTQIQDFLDYCSNQRKLDKKTIKAYRIDLSQYQIYASTNGNPFSKDTLSNYIQNMHRTYKPKTVKRKIASIRAFFNYLEYEDILLQNPISKIRLDFREPISLPRTVQLSTLKKLFKSAYCTLDMSDTEYRTKAALRDIAVLELLFATGIRVSELCNIYDDCLDLKNGFVKIFGKGSKERMIYITNPSTLSALKEYRKVMDKEIESCGYFFINKNGNRLSDQSVRNMIFKHSKTAKIQEHITPHMIRHSFATLMLEEDVDIRYIQSILGHSSITTTQIYTHVSLAKQKKILLKNHPRNKMII